MTFIIGLESKILSKCSGKGLFDGGYYFNIRIASKKTI